MNEEQININNPLSDSAILKNIPVGIIVFDKDNVITSVTENLFRFGVTEFSSEEELVGINLSEKDIFREISIKEEIGVLEKSYGFEKIITSKGTLDGGQISIILKASLILSENGYSGGVILIEDIRTNPNRKTKADTSLSELKQVLIKVSDAILVVDSTGLICDIEETRSLELSEILGVAKDNTVDDIGNSELSEKINEIICTDSTGKNPNKGTVVEVKGIPLNVNVFPIPDVEDEKRKFIFLFKDISNLDVASSDVKAELAELRRYQQIASAVADAVINTDLEGKINFWNDQAEALFGLKKSAVFGQFIGKILPLFSEQYFTQLKKELKQNKVWESRLKYGAIDKTEYLQLRVVLIEDDDESFIVILCSNITKQIKLERKLRQSEERFRDIVTNTREYICTLDLNENITYVNPHFLDTFGYTEEEFVSLNFKDLIQKKYMKEKGFDLKLFDINNVQTKEIPLLGKNGNVIYVNASFSVVTDLNDRPKYYNAILTDITAQKKTERDLLLIKSVFDASNEGIAVVTNRKLVLVNEKYVKMFGYNSSVELIGKDPLDMVDNSEIPAVAAKVEQLEKEPNKPLLYEYKAMRKDESVFHAENSTISYSTDSSLYIVSIIRDVTEEKKAEIALKESEEKYRSITENISESLWTAEIKKRKLETVFYTSGVEKITGYKANDFMSNNKLWYKIIHPDDLEYAIKRFKRLYRDSAREKEEIEYRIIDRFGGVVWIKNKVNVQRDAQGNIEKIFGLVSDISLSKRAEEELKKSTENLKKLNDTKDKFISIISHDLRTPFSSIIGFAELLMNEEETDPEKRDQYVKFIYESSKSMLNLVNSLLDWTRLQTGRLNFEPTRVNSKSIIYNSYQMISGAALNKNIRIINDVMYDLFIHGDSDLLLQVFNNLLSNAIKFTESGGQIVISAYPQVEDRLVKFSVKDSGVGIKEADLEKLFKVDSKFTLAGTAGEKGSGLGLSLCYDIVQKHGGKIWVESTYGEGTDFLFTIPISSTKILLVDDMKTDRLLYTKLLSSILPNYIVDTADNGKEAFNMIKQSMPALVITDHQMPVMSGYELVERINREEMSFKPPIIVLSTDVTPGIEQDYRELGINYVFRKPVDIASFKKAIEESLKKAIFT